MASKIIDYQILHDSGPAATENEVQRLIQEGWQPLGGVSIDSASGRCIQAMVLHESNEPIALPLQLQTPPSLDEQEKQIILAALQKYGGHRIQTATALGMGVRTLGMKLRAWGMSRVPVAPEAH